MKTETTMGAARTLFVPGALLALMFVASAALADPSEGPAGTPRGTSETRIVKYADLDLTRAADVATLYQRIEDTAKRVCTPLGNIVADDACLSDALARTIAAVHAIRGWRDESEVKADLYRKASSNGAAAKRRRWGAPETGIGSQ